MSGNADMGRDDLIDQAAELDDSIYAYPDDERTLFACATFWGHGHADEQYGSITEPPFIHIYRVNRWLVSTDAQGRDFLTECGSEKEARAEYASIVAEVEAEMADAS